MFIKKTTGEIKCNPITVSFERRLNKIMNNFLVLVRCRKYRLTVAIVQKIHLLLWIWLYIVGKLSFWQSYSIVAVKAGLTPFSEKLKYISSFNVPGKNKTWVGCSMCNFLDHFPNNNDLLHHLGKKEHSSDKQILRS